MAMAVPVFVAGGSAVGAVTVHWPSLRFEEGGVDATLAVLHDAANEIALQMDPTTG